MENSIQKIAIQGATKKLASHSDKEVEDAKREIKGPAKVNEVLPKVEKSKRDDVLRELREEKKASIEKIGMTTDIGKDIGWR